ncbi:MAG: protein kinase [Polyangiaceae bacterium]
MYLTDAIVRGLRQREPELIGDRFEVIAEAGSGGMGTVYHARDRVTGNEVAVKVLASRAADPARFARETNILARLSHPHVVGYVAHGELAEGEPYLAMDWLSGETLRSRLARSALTAEQSLRLAARVADGLAAAHAAGVIHRDLKPSNLFLEGGDPARVKVIDFGVARFFDAHDKLTETGQVLGTPGYMAPEQARGMRELDARADLFALGCVLYRCLTSKPAFDGPDVMSVLAKLVLHAPPRPSADVPGLSPEIDELVARLLAKEPDARPAGAAVVREEIEWLLRKLGAAPFLSRPPPAPRAAGDDDAPVSGSAPTEISTPGSGALATRHESPQARGDAEAPVSSAREVTVEKPTPARPTPTGPLVAGKYRLGGLLGEGGMGAVFDARNELTQRRVALKRIRRVGGAADPERVARFQREARAAGAIDTPHIVQVLDAGTDDATGDPFLVLEHLSGEDAKQLLARVGPLPVELAVRVAAQAALGLCKAHQAGVVHRDIKPANLLLARTGDGEVVVKICDFGIAKVQPEEALGDGERTLTRTGTMIGSPAYMSPEQAQGLKSSDHRGDLWALGAVLFELLSGRQPHDDYETLGQLLVAICTTAPRDVRTVAPWVPADVARIVERCLRIDAAQRYPSAQALLDDLRACSGGATSLRAEALKGVGEEELRLAPAPSVRGPLPDPTTASAAVVRSVAPPPQADDTFSSAPTERSPRRGRRALGAALLAGLGLVVVGVVARTLLVAPAPVPEDAAASGATAAGIASTPNVPAAERAVPAASAVTVPPHASTGAPSATPPPSTPSSTPTSTSAAPPKKPRTVPGAAGAAAPRASATVPPVATEAASAKKPEIDTDFR